MYLQFAEEMPHLD